LNSSAVESVFIGDGGSNELAGAQNCGLTTVMVAGVIREWWPDKAVAQSKFAARSQFADFQVEFIDELL